MADCVFCKIVVREIPATIVREDEHTLAFKDLNPRAPFHALVIPKRHVTTLSELDDGQLAGRLLLAATAVAQDAGHGQSFRLVANNGSGAGQSVFHLHFHVLGGRMFGWPPG